MSHDSILIMQLDQASAYKAKRLKLPANIIADVRRHIGQQKIFDNIRY